MINFLRRLFYAFKPSSAYADSYMEQCFYNSLVVNGRSARLVFDATKGHLVCLASQDLATRDYGVTYPPKASGLQLEAVKTITAVHVANYGVEASGRQE